VTGARLRDRPTSDLLVLIIAGTICCCVLCFGTAVAVLAFTQPDKSHADAANLLGDSLQLLVGLLAGFMAGRSGKTPTDTTKGARP
jgi:hypothetical protein